MYTRAYMHYNRFKCMVCCSQLPSTQAPTTSKAPTRTTFHLIVDTYGLHPCELHTAALIRTQTGRPAHPSSVWTTHSWTHTYTNRAAGSPLIWAASVWTTHSCTHTYTNWTAGSPLTTHPLLCIGGSLSGVVCGLLYCTIYLCWVLKYSSRI